MLLEKEMGDAFFTAEGSNNPIWETTLGATKALGIMFQVYGLLSPKHAH